MDQSMQKGRPQALTPALRSILGGGTTAFFNRQVPLRQDQPMRTGPVQGFQLAAGPIPAPQALRQLPFLGQPTAAPGPAPAPAAPAAPPPAPAAPPIPPGQCPGAISMPDGRTIEPDDYIKLNDLCLLLPKLFEAWGKAMQQARGLTPGQSVPVVGAPPGGAQPIPGFPGFGPSQGPFGGGGGAMFGGGGGGPGPKGEIGPAGPTGPAGPGNAVDFIEKTDGDFSAGPGAYISVPGTLLTFSVAADGPVIILLQAVLGCFSPQSAEIGLRIDGTTDHALNRRTIHTFVGGVGEFYIGQPGILTLPMTAGTHTVEVVLRGLLPGEGCSGTGIGIAAQVQANTILPLRVTVLHK